MSVRGGQGGGRGGHSGRGSRGRDRGSRHYIPTLNKIKVYAVNLETTSLFMVRKEHNTRYGRLGKRFPTMLAPSTGTASATNLRKNQRSPSPRLNTLKMYSRNTNITWN